MGAQVDAGMDKTDLKKFLGYAKKDPVNCAVGISDGKPVIVLDRVKKPKAIEKDLSDKLPDMKVVRWGTASIDQDNPKLVVLRLNKSASGLAAKLRKPLKEAGFSQVEIRLEDGTVAEKVSDEEDERTPRRAARRRPRRRRKPPQPRRATGRSSPRRRRRTARAMPARRRRRPMPVMPARHRRKPIPAI